MVRYATRHLFRTSRPMKLHVIFLVILEKRITRHKATNSMVQEFCSKDDSRPIGQQTKPASCFAYPTHSNTQKPKICVVTYNFFPDCPFVVAVKNDKENLCYFTTLYLLQRWYFFGYSRFIALHKLQKREVVLNYLSCLQWIRMWLSTKMVNNAQTAQIYWY